MSDQVPKKRNRRKEYAKRKFTRLEKKVAEFETFQQEFAPKLRALLQDPNTKAEDILEFGKKLAAARAVTVAHTEVDAGKAMSASKDILDRTMGKAKETTSVEHKFAKLDEEQLDSLLLSKLKEAGLAAGKDDEEGGDHDGH